MKELLAITRALSDENRLRVLLALRGGELCVCQLVELLQLAPSTVSKHMAVLRQAGLVDLRREGRWVYYRIAGKDAPTPVREAIDWVCNAAAGSERAVKDAKRLGKIRRMNKEKLCRVTRER